MGSDLLFWNEDRRMNLGRQVDTPLELAKIGTCNSKVYLVAVPKDMSTAEIEEEVGIRLGLKSTPDGYEISLTDRSPMNGLGLTAWSIFEEVY